jgi:hypothetical protein
MPTVGWWGANVQRAGGDHTIVAVGDNAVSAATAEKVAPISQPAVTCLACETLAAFISRYAGAGWLGKPGDAGCTRTAATFMP